MAYFTKFIESLRKRDSEIADTVEFLLSRGRACESPPKNIFERPTTQDLEHLQTKIPHIVNNQQSLIWPLVSKHFKSTKYLPIRAFRSDPSSHWQAVDKLRIFLSSGTSSSPEGRSSSCFSDKGLQFYRAGSIAAFFDVLQTRIAPFCDENLTAVTVSLIPKKSEWPDSSLAQMVAWISEIWKTFYSENDDEQKIVECIDSATNLNVPLVIFGTAFHFVNLFDSGARFSLPPGSVVIETGGTKGRSRSVTRIELYQMIANGFGIKQSEIISEYGMCEIASPAWDMALSDQQLDLSKRTFKFPWWVQIGTMTSASSVNTIGEGVLIIEDALRIDLPNLAIQTEDLANIIDHNETVKLGKIQRSCNSFQMLGRVPKAPLKGCSLRVKDLGEGKCYKTKSIVSPNSLKTTAQEDLVQNAKIAKTWIENILNDDTSVRLLTQELESKSLATLALDDLRRGLPHHIEDYVQAALHSAAHKHHQTESLTYHRKWLLIAPASHSIALIQPLLAAMILGLELRIRLPDINHMNHEKTFLAYAVHSMKMHGFTPIVLDRNWRLGPEDLLDEEFVLVFGDDETCQFMNHFAPGRISAFGNATSMSLVSSDVLYSPDGIQKLWQDQINLHQRGCLSSRAIFIIGSSRSEVQDKFRNHLSTTSTNSDSTQTVGTLAAHSLEEVRFKQLGYHVVAGLDPTGNPVQVVIKEITTTQIKEVLSSELSLMDMIIPVFVLPENIDEILVITEIANATSLRALTVDGNIKALVSTKIKDFNHSSKYRNFPKNLRIVSIGNLGSPRFDGTHLGTAFFTTGFGNHL